MDPVPTERLWLTEPQRAAAKARVVAVRGPRFALDRTLFAPRSRLYRHPQPPDRGHARLANGEKRWLKVVEERGGTLWHLLDGATPRRDEELQLHLDVERRAEHAGAHTAMHLVLSALAPERDLPLAEAPEVRGGGSFRLVLGVRHVAAERLARLLARANAWAAADLPVVREHVTRDAAAHRLLPQHFADAVQHPGPEATLEAVRIEGVGALGCDGTPAARTGATGRIVITAARPDGEGRFVVLARAEGA